MPLNVAEWYQIDTSSESVSKKFNENQNLVEDILGAAVASITNALHMCKKIPPVKFD